MFDIREENFFERIASALFPPKMGHLSEAFSSKEYFTRMTQRHGDLNDIGMLYDACGPVKVWSHGRWKLVRE